MLRYFRIENAAQAGDEAIVRSELKPESYFKLNRTLRPHDFEVPIAIAQAFEAERALCEATANYPMTTIIWCWDDSENVARGWVVSPNWRQVEPQ